MATCLHQLLNLFPPMPSTKVRISSTAQNLSEFFPTFSHLRPPPPKKKRRKDYAPEMCNCCWKKLGAISCFLFLPIFGISLAMIIVGSVNQAKSISEGDGMSSSKCDTTFEYLRPFQFTTDDGDEYQCPWPKEYTILRTTLLSLAVAMALLALAALEAREHYRSTLHLRWYWTLFKYMSFCVGMCFFPIFTLDTGAVATGKFFFIFNLVLCARVTLGALGIPIILRKFCLQK